MRKTNETKDAERHKDLVKALNELIAASKKNAAEKKTPSEKLINQR